MSEAQQASHDAASALLDSPTALTLLELRRRSNEHYQALLQARIAGLRAEVELQRTLEQLSVAEYRRVIAMLDAPGHHLPPTEGSSPAYRWPLQMTTSAPSRSCQVY
ncbi:hypothetical protein V5O39_31030 [Pseudomonas parakoreensis]